MRHAATLLLAFFLLAGTAAAETITHLLDTLQVPGTPTAVAVQGDGIYITTESKELFAVDGASGGVVAIFDMGMYMAEDLTILGDMLIAATAYDIWVYDISTPTAPTELGHLGTYIETPHELVVGPDSIGYFTRSSRDLTVITFKNPANPAILYRSGSDGWKYRGVAQEGSRVYVCASYGGAGRLTVYDVSDPAAPASMGSFDLATLSSDPFMDVAVRDSILFLAGYSEGIFSLDATDPANITQLGHLYDSMLGHDDARTVIVSGDTLFVGNNKSGVYSVDVSDPASMVQLQARTVGSWDEIPLHYLPGRLVTVEPQGMVQYLDTGTLAPAMSVATGGFNRGLVARGDTLVVMGRGGGFSVYDISTRDDPVEMSQVSLPEINYNSKAALKDNLLVFRGATGAGERKLYLYDLADWTNPAHLATINRSGNGSFAVWSDTLAVADDNLTFYWINDPANPSVLYEEGIGYGDQFDQLIYYKGYLIGSGYYKAPTVLDISNLANVTPVSSLGSGLTRPALIAEGDRLYHAGGGQVQIFDLGGFPELGLISGNVPLDANYSFTVKKGFGYGAAYNSFTVKDLNNPANLRTATMDRMPLLKDLQNDAITVQDDHLYVAEWTKLSIHRIEPAPPAPFTLALPADSGYSPVDSTVLLWRTAGDINTADTVAYEILLGQAEDLSDATSLTADLTATHCEITELTTLADNTTYHWTVVARDGSGHTTAASDTLAFSTFVSHAPSAFSALTPADGTVIDVSGLFPLDFTWSEASDPDPGESVGYVLELADNQQFSDPITFPAGENLTVTVSSLPIDSYWWRVRAEDLQGHTVYSDTLLLDVTLDVPADEAGLPERYELSSAYPNPFNPTTAFRVSLPEAARVRAEVFNLLGRRVARLSDGQRFGAGAHRFVFDAAGLASGVYFLRVEVPGRLLATRRLVLMR